MQLQFSGPPQKHRFGCTCILCLPWPERFRQPEAWPHSPRMWCAFSLHGEWPRQPEACAHSPRVQCAFFLCSPSARHSSGLRKSLDRKRGPVCSVGGGGFSGAEFAPFPFPLPPTSSRNGPALLWSFSVSLFCESPAVCSGRLIFPCYPTV